MKRLITLSIVSFCTQVYASACNDLLQQIKREGTYYKNAKVYDCSIGVSGTGDFYQPGIKACVIDLYYKDKPNDVFDINYRSSIYILNKKITYNGRSFKAEIGNYVTNLEKNHIKSFPQGFDLGRDDFSSEFFNNGTSRLSIAMDGEFHMKATFDRNNLNFWYEMWEDTWFGTSHLNMSSKCKLEISDQRP